MKRFAEKKTYAQIKAEKAAKREAKGKAPIKTVAEIREGYHDERQAMKDRKVARKAAGATESDGEHSDD